MNKFFINYWKRLKKITLKQVIVYLCILLFGVTFLFVFKDSASEVYDEAFLKKATDNGIVYHYKVKVLEIVQEDFVEDIYGNETVTYVLRCRVLYGNEEEIGKNIFVLQYIVDGIKGKTLKAKVGSIIYISPATGEYPIPPGYIINWQFYGVAANFSRTFSLLILTIIFVLLIISFSGFQGVNTILALMFTLMAVFFVLIPKILTEHNIYLWTFIVSVYTILITLMLVIGINKKSFCAAIGCFGGILIIAILTLIVRSALYLTGNYDDSTYELNLILINKERSIDLQALIFASITLGSMGAIIDTAISLASSLYEVALKDNNPKSLIKSGFVIGRDMLGTMSNTLMLAYLGGSLAMVLFTILYYTLEGIMRLEILAIEISQAIIGTIGMLAAIPITTILCAFMYPRKKD